MDEKDLQILSILQQDGRTSNAEIARRLGMKPETFSRSLAKLRAVGIETHGATVSVDDYLRLHDISLSTAMDAWAGRDGEPAADSVLHDLSSRLVDRRLFKTFDLGDDRTAAERLWPQALETAEKRFGTAARFYVHLDTARHAAYLASDDEELHVIDHPKYGAVTLSRLLEDMPLGQPTAKDLTDEMLQEYPRLREIVETGGADGGERTANDSSA